MRFVEEKLKRMEQWIRKNKNKNTTIRIRILSHHRISSLLSSLFPFTIEITLLKKTLYTPKFVVVAIFVFHLHRRLRPTKYSKIYHLSPFFFFFCSGSLNRIVHAHRLCFDFAFLWTVSFLFVFFFVFFFIHRVLTSRKFTRKSIDFSYNKKKNLSYGDKFNLRVFVRS